MLTPGTPCPKHDLELEAGPPEPTATPKHSGPWVTVGKFADALRAEAPRIRLEAEGIPTFLEGERMGSPSMYHVATGGVKLQVPEPLAGDARILLAQSWLVPGADDDLDEAWDDLEPDPSAPRRDVGLALVWLILITPFLLYALAVWLGAR
jgi:hypothetical protein